MANFNTHFMVASGESAVVSGTLLSMEVVSPEEAVIAFLLGIFGGLLPDIDSARSTAIKVGFNVFSLLVTAMVVFIKSSTYSLIEMFIVAGFVFSGIRFTFLDFFRKISKHRGMFHSIPVAFIFGIVVSILMQYFFSINSLVAWVYGFMITTGYFVHLILDEIYSVDLENKRMKKSAGTAMKFGRFKTKKDTLQTVVIYASIPLLMRIAPDTTLIINALFSHDAWITFKDVLLPYDGKWFVH